jgi:sigma-B regulation protein RsbU (phosphoserine phosphatase)
LCAFLELSLGVVRLLIKILIFAGVAVALAGMGWFVFGGSGDKFIPYNTLIAVCGLLILVTVVAVKKLSDRFMLLLNRRVLAIGTLVFAVEALWGNLSRNLHYQTPRVLGHLAFAVFLLSFALVAFQMISANERRLMSIENELAVARRLQFSILPTSIPEVRNILIAVAYQPTDCRRWRFL